MSEEEEIIDKLKNHIDYNSYEDYEKVLKLIDLYNKEKEQNKININSINDLIKECNEENKRCSELAIELQAEKEKNKELENCLQMAKQIMTADISEDFGYMKLKEFKEYLLNEIKLNENFGE